MPTLPVPRILLPAAAVLAAVLSACGGGGEPPPAAVTLELKGESVMVIGAAAQMSAVVRDLSGNVLPAAVTYTSSQPSVISVDAQGKLTARRLTATGQPVVMTASASGKQATLNVSTYGLELALGNYVWNTQPAGDAPGRFIAVRYRPASGKTEASDFMVTAPGGAKLSCELSLNDVNGWCWWALPNAAKFPAGEYLASLIQGGVTYNTSALWTDRQSLLGFVGAAKATGTGRAVAFSGQIPDASKRIFSYLTGNRGNESQLDGELIDSVYSTALPVTLNVDAGVPAGTYRAWIASMAGNLNSVKEVLPEQFDVSVSYAGLVTLP